MQKPEETQQNLIENPEEKPEEAPNEKPEDKPQENIQQPQQNQKKNNENEFIKTSLRIFLTIIPLIICIYSIYYLVQVAKSIFVAAIGASNAVIAAILILSSLISCATAIIGLKDYNPKAPTIKFHIYFISSILGFVLLITVLIYTSVSSQSTYENHVSLFYSLDTTNPDSVSFTNDHLTEFSRLQYFFTIGENSNEVYVILTAIWFIAFISFFVVSEFDEKEEELKTT